MRETLEANRWPIHEIHLADRLSDDEIAGIRSAAQRQQIPVSVESASRLTQLSHTEDHQGFLAKMGPFPYVPVQDALQASEENAIFLILDSIQDSHNFGAVIRSAEVFGVDAVVIGERRQAAVNSLVARSSAGAVNRVPILRIADVAAFIQQLRERGTAVYGASEKGPQPIFDCDLNGSVALVIGNEGTGITPEVQAACHGLLCIPQKGRIGSLNAAVAAGIVLYEVRRQR